MLKNQKAISEQARQMKGHPVCVVLKNGSFYVGWIKDIEKGQLILSGKKGKGRLRHSSSLRTKKARISGFFPGFSSPLANVGEFGPIGFSPSEAAASETGGASAGLFGGFGGVFDFIKKSWPAVSMGIGMVKTIMPLLGGLKG